MIFSFMEALMSLIGLTVIVGRGIVRREIF